MSNGDGVEAAAICGQASTRLKARRVGCRGSIPNRRSGQAGSVMRSPMQSHSVCGDRSCSPLHEAAERCTELVGFVEMREVTGADDHVENCPRG